MGEWIVRDRITVGLVLGDLGVIVAMIAVGLASHGTTPFAHPWYVLRTAGPFLIVWVLVSPVSGVYRPRARTTVEWAIVTTIGGWTGTSILGAGIRRTEFVPGGAPPLFVAILVGVGLIVITPWRVLVVLLLDRFTS